MKRFCLVLLLVSFLTSGVFAATTDWVDQIGQWNEASKWTGGVPDGDKEIRVRGGYCVLSSSQIWSSTADNRTRVYEDATLVITDGAQLIGPGWLRVGASDAATVYQTGGLLKLRQGRDNTRLVIGDDDDSDGLYVISGGTITYESGDGHLTLGDRGGTGTFHVFGAGATIQMNSLRVGGRDSGRAATGTLEFSIGEFGVSAIQVADVRLDPAGDSSTADLVISLIGSPTLADSYLLVENTGGSAVSGIFDTVNGNPAPEGATVTLGANVYKLTYVGGVGGNDIMLVPEPATMLLLGLGSLIAIRKRK